MFPDIHIPEPVLFNPLKHHIGFIREFTERRSGVAILDSTLLRELRHIGTSVMDVYTGRLDVESICREVTEFINKTSLTGHDEFAAWAGMKVNDFRILTLSDQSDWTVKYHNSRQRFVHIFPARFSRYTFRIKSNTLKSALIYYMVIGKDYITEADLNRARTYLDLSPVREIENTEAITEMIELLRNTRE